MASPSKTTSVTPADSADWTEVVRRQVERLRFGVVQIVVHDRRVVQVESTEKIRLDPPAPPADR